MNGYGLPRRVALILAFLEVLATSMAASSAPEAACDDKNQLLFSQPDGLDVVKALGVPRPVVTAHDFDPAPSSVGGGTSPARSGGVWFDRDLKLLDGGLAEQSVPTPLFNRGLQVGGQAALLIATAQCFDLTLVGYDLRTGSRRQAYVVAKDWKAGGPPVVRARQAGPTLGGARGWLSVEWRSWFPDESGGPAATSFSESGYQMDAGRYAGTLLLADTTGRTLVRREVTPTLGPGPAAMVSGAGSMARWITVGASARRDGFRVVALEGWDGTRRVWQSQAPVLPRLQDLVETPGGPVLVTADAEDAVAAQGMTRTVRLTAVARESGKVRWYRDVRGVATAVSVTATGALVVAERSPSARSYEVWDSDSGRTTFRIAGDDPPSVTGDVDGDGVADLWRARTQWRSGRNGSLHSTGAGTDSADAGAPTVMVGDVDGDRHADFLTVLGGSPALVLRLISGADGSVRWTTPVVLPATSPARLVGFQDMAVVPGSAGRSRLALFNVGSAHTLVALDALTGAVVKTTPYGAAFN